jgi:hypothetical protein
MAPSFGRSISFPLSPARASRPRAAAYHVRSISLPCQSHPLLAHLCTHIAAVRSWLAAPASPSTGLAHLDALHAALAALAELLLLPESRAALHHGSATASCLLDGFLILADAHGAFQETAVELKAYAADAQAALRRRDDNRLASAVRSLRRAEKDLARLAASVRAAAKFPTMLSASSSAAEVEVSGALAEAVAAAACASAAVFSAVESMSSAATTALASKKTMTSSLMSLVKTAKPAASDEEREVAVLERLEEVEACVAEVESGSDKVFRSILHTRVALLNIQTQTCC